MLLEALNRGQCFSLPGVFDPFSARIAAHYVKGPLYMTGYGVSATLLGKPDAGLVSYSQMVERLAQITAVIDVPVVADGDTGFGGWRTLRKPLQAMNALAQPLSSSKIRNFRNGAAIPAIDASLTWRICKKK